MHWATPGQDAVRDSGMSTVEVVLLAPVVVFALLLMVGAGLMVNAKGVLGSASSDAARMGSLQRDPTDAAKQATTVADEDLKGSVSCVDHPGGAPSVSAATPGGFAPRGLFTVTVECKVNYLGMSLSISSTSVSPIDAYRETN
jgi:Flp pilus assembly protein TadG